MTTNEKMQAMAPIYAAAYKAASDLAKTSKGALALIAATGASSVITAVEVTAKREAIATFNATYP
jgi:hypothetical protein